jgi:hypothetical protein
MDPTQPAPDPQALAMLMALMGGGSGQQGVPPGSPMMGGAAQQQQMMNMPQQPLMNGQNASLGAATGASLATPQDMMMNSMMQPVPQQ